jgi:hypothetical protein
MVDLSPVTSEALEKLDHCPRWIIVDQDEDADQIIKEMEERGEIAPAATFPRGRVRVIVRRLVKPPSQ